MGTPDATPGHGGGFRAPEQMNIAQTSRVSRRVMSPSRSARGTCMFALMVACFASPLLAAGRFSVSMPAWVSSLNFSPDSKRLAAGCADSSARVLETETGKESIALHGHED